MEAYLERAVLRIFDYFHKGEESIEDKTQRFYYSLVLVLMMDLGNQYGFIPHYESGLGRYDVILELKDVNEKAFILEFKTYDKETEEGLDDTIQAAFEQIEEKQYTERLIHKGILKEKIYRYAFAFDGKRVTVANRSSFG